MSCGFPGQGLQTRGRHRAQEAANGGRKCMGGKTEDRVCQHEKLMDKGNSSDTGGDGGKPIFYCPGESVLFYFQPQNWIQIFIFPLAS